MTKSLQKICELSEVIYSTLTDSMVDKCVDESRIDDVCCKLKRLLPSRVDDLALKESMVYLIGCDLSKIEAFKLSKRLSGNIDKLCLGEAIYPPLPETVSHGSVLQIFRLNIKIIDKARIGRRKIAQLSLGVLTGPMAGESLSSWWSFRQCRRVARIFGFSRVNRESREPPKYPFLSPSQFVNMRFLASISGGTGVIFESIKMTPSLAKWNKELIKKRFRIDRGYSCPRGYPRNHYCHQCHIGYHNCVAATHPDDWIVGDCYECHSSGVWVDPYYSRSTCVNCLSTLS